MFVFVPVCCPIFYSRDDYRSEQGMFFHAAWIVIRINFSHFESKEVKLNECELYKPNRIGIFCLKSCSK